MITLRLGQGEGIPGSGDEPGTPTPVPDPVAAEEAANEEARKKQRVIALSVLGAGAIIGLGSLIYFVREPGSRRRREPLRVNQIFCRHGIRYRVGYSGKLVRVGNC